MEKIMNNGYLSKYKPNLFNNIIFKIKKFFKKDSGKGNFSNLEIVKVSENKTVKNDEEVDALRDKFENNTIDISELAEDEIVKLKYYYMNEIEKVDLEIKRKKEILNNLNEALIKEYDRAIKLKEKYDVNT